MSSTGLRVRSETMGTLIRSTGPWATMDSGPDGPRDAAALKDAGEHTGWALYAESGMIRETGPVAELAAAHPAAEVVDLGDRLVIPGFVDPHTHPVFAGTREEEFEMRILGRSYEDIAKAGGGIRNSARRFRGASREQLVADLRDTADRFLLLGSTTVEAKSGYARWEPEPLRWAGVRTGRALNAYADAKEKRTGRRARCAERTLSMMGADYGY